jgi:hypothetical protein
MHAPCQAERVCGHHHARSLKRTENKFINLWFASFRFQVEAEWLLNLNAGIVGIRVWVCTDVLSSGSVCGFEVRCSGTRWPQIFIKVTILFQR